MPEQRSSDTVTELERRILRALCGRECSAGEWSALASPLAEYCWQDPDHRVVHEALTAIRCPDAETRRGQLPAQATRMGFPDVDWKVYFEPEELPEPALEDLIRRLKAETPERL